MVATDVYRPAAIDQLVTLGQRVGVPVFEMGTDARPADIAKAGLQQARKVCRPGLAWDKHVRHHRMSSTSTSASQQRANSLLDSMASACKESTRKQATVGFIPTALCPCLDL